MTLRRVIIRARELIEMCLRRNDFISFFSGKTILHAQNMIMRTAVNVGLFYLTLYVNKRGNKKTLQTIHKPYI